MPAVLLLLTLLILLDEKTIKIQIIFKSSSFLLGDPKNEWVTVLIDYETKNKLTSQNFINIFPWHCTNSCIFICAQIANLLQATCTVLEYCG